MLRKDIDWRELGDVIRDPYPCLHVDDPGDSDLWLKLFLMAKEEDFEMFCILDYLRGTGCKLEPSEKFGYKIVPLIGEDAWISMDQYNKEKMYLKPYQKQLGKILKKLANPYDDIPI